jgi:hypothetical protein
MYISPEDETSYTTQHPQAFLNYVENKHCVKHTHLLVTKSENIPNNNLSDSSMHLDLVNLLMIHMICPAMMKNT